MDDVPEVADVVADSGFEGIVAWLFRPVLPVAPGVRLLAAEFA